MARLGLPINNTLLITSDTSMIIARKAIEEFYLSNQIKKADKILVRAEKQFSICENQIKGTQLNFYMALKHIEKLLIKGYNAIITFLLAID